jgi:hypothetical protein
MNYLAAILLMHIGDEVKAFWCFVYILYRKNWRMVYDNSTPKLISLLDIVRDRLDKHEPELLHHMENQLVSLEGAFSPMFLTLFIY